MKYVEVPVDRWLYGHLLRGGECVLCSGSKADIVGWLLHCLRKTTFKSMAGRHLPERDDERYLTDLLGQADYDKLYELNDRPAQLTYPVEKRQADIARLLRKHNVHVKWI